MADCAPVLDGLNDTGVQVDLDTSGQPTSTPTTNNVCTDTCTFKTKRSGKQHDMIMCAVVSHGLRWTKKRRPSRCLAMHLMSTHPGANNEHCSINIDPDCSHEQYIEQKQQSD